MFQTPAVPVAGPHLREVRAGDVYPQRAGGRGRRRLFVRVLQRGHRRLLQTSQYSETERCYSELVI